MDQPHVVIVGAGFGGLAAARAMASLPVRVTLIDRTNHHLFQPLLYQVATAGLSPADIASPIRSILRQQKRLEIRKSEVTGVDPQGKSVQTADGDIAYDYLILATGARHSYFGNDQWEVHAPGLKTITNATTIRHRVLGAFEEAEKAASEADRERYMTFVVVGGGPTGAEMAGSIAELARRVLACDFDHIDPRRSHIILVEAADRLLGGLPAPLGEKAADYLRELGVDVRLRVRVTGIEVGCVHTDAGAIPTETTIWAAGVQASPAARWLGSESDRQGRVIVKPDLSVEGHPEVFVIGDTAHFAGKDGKPLPGVAPVALQQGTFLGEVLRARLDEQPSPVFEYRDKGDLATVGRRRAVARIGDRHFTGRLAWLIWVFVHIMELATFRNRLVVLIQWIWGYFTWERGARLIVEDRSPARRADDARAQQSDL
mgnify:CR=1 FL=1